MFSSLDLVRATMLVAAGAVLVAVAHAQPASAKGAASAASTPSNLPPGATSTSGNKAAVPSAAASGTNPNTGSTSGTVPGASSTRGDKATTPKSPAPRASAASAAN